MTSSSSICLFHNRRYSSNIQCILNLLRINVIKIKCDLNQIAKKILCICNVSDNQTIINDEEFNKKIGCMYGDNWMGLEIMGTKIVTVPKKIGKWSWNCLYIYGKFPSSLHKALAQSHILDGRFNFEEKDFEWTSIFVSSNRCFINFIISSFFYYLH